MSDSMFKVKLVKKTMNLEPIGPLPETIVVTILEIKKPVLNRLF